MPARRKTNLLVILNDNDMSISENVGALSNYFAKVLSGRMYSTAAIGRQEDPQADAHDVGTGAPLGRNDEGHGVCRARCSRSWASTTSAPWMATTSRSW